RRKPAALVGIHIVNLTTYHDVGLPGALSSPLSQRVEREAEFLRLLAFWRVTGNLFSLPLSHVWPPPRTNNQETREKRKPSEPPWIGGADRRSAHGREWLGH